MDELETSLFTNQAPSDVPTIGMELHPDYANRQREIINALHTGPITEVIPEHLRKYTTNTHPEKDRKEIVYQADGSRIEVTQFPNGITGLQELQPTILPSPITLEPAFTVENYFLIDTHTKKAWDVSQLWKNTNEQVITAPGSNATLFTVAKEGVFLFISNINESLPTKLFNTLQKLLHKGDMTATGQIGTTVHEVGHSIQFSHETRGKLPLGMLDMAGMVGPLVINLAATCYQALKPFPNLQEKLQHLKQDYVKIERNAHAFSLGVIRKIRDEGVDIYRDKTPNEIIKAIDIPLRTYTAAFLGIPGMSASQKYRAQYRAKHSET